MISWILYFALFLHFGFGVFLVLTFAAYVGAVSESRAFEALTVAYLLAFMAVEGLGCWWLLAHGHASMLWLCLGAAMLLALLTVSTLAALKRADLTIWIPFCVLFTPLLIIPMLLFIRLFYAQLKGMDVELSAESILGKRDGA